MTTSAKPRTRKLASRPSRTATLANARNPPQRGRGRPSASRRSSSDLELSPEPIATEDMPTTRRSSVRVRQKQENALLASKLAASAAPASTETSSNASSNSDDDRDDASKASEEDSGEEASSSEDDEYIEPTMATPALTPATSASTVDEGDHAAAAAENMGGSPQNHKRKNDEEPLPSTKSPQKRRRLPLTSRSNPMSLEANGLDSVSDSDEASADAVSPFRGSTRVDMPPVVLGTPTRASDVVKRPARLTRAATLAEKLAEKLAQNVQPPLELDLSRHSFVPMTLDLPKKDHPEDSGESDKDVDAKPAAAAAMEVDSETTLVTESVATIVTETTTQAETVVLQETLQVQEENTVTVATDTPSEKRVPDAADVAPVSPPKEINALDVPAHTTVTDTTESGPAAETESQPSSPVPHWTDFWSYLLPFGPHQDL